jgi:hypothetical protein
MIVIVVLFVIVSMVILALMRASPKRLVQRKGTVHVNICPDCGQPAGKCRRDTRRAETASSFTGSLSRKRRR